MKIAWTQELYLDIPEIDEQHKRLIELIAEFHNAIERGEREEGIRALFDGVDRYAAIHFAWEEAFLERIGYPDLPKHRETHKIYRQEYMMALERHQQGDPKAIRDLVAFLFSWLYTHIHKTDRRYADFYHQQGKAA